jgi:hypothetical protein
LVEETRVTLTEIFWKIVFNIDNNHIF